MIGDEVVRKVEALLGEGIYSYRDIARLTGVGRTTIGQIANGKRQLLPGRQTEFAVLEPTEPPRRCPTCGGLVYHPCVLCQVRDLQARDRCNPRSPSAWHNV